MFKIRKSIAGLLCMLAFSGSLIANEAAALPERFVQLQELAGEVQVKPSADSSWRIAEMGMKLGSEAEIRTGKNSKAVLIIDDFGSTGKVDMLSGSWMRIGVLSYTENNSKKTLLDLGLGKLLVHAEKLIGDASFQVRTPTSTSTVKGTIFEVEVGEV